MSRRPPVPPALVLALGILAVSTASIFIRYAQRDVPSLTIAAYRLGLASLLLLPIAWSRHRHELRRLDAASLWSGILAGLFLAIHFAAWIQSLAYTSIASSVVLVTTTPLWVALLSPLVLRERLTRAVLLGMLLTLAGGIVIGLSDTCRLEGSLTCPPVSEFVRGQAVLGDLLALLGAWMAAGYLLIGRRLRRQLSMISYVTLVYGAAAVFLTAGVFLTRTPFTGFPAGAYLWLVLLALIPQLIGHSSFNWALGYLPAAFVSITLLGEPVGTIVLAYLVLGEQPTSIKLIGGSLILAGIYIASRSGPSSAATK